MVSIVHSACGEAEVEVVGSGRPVLILHGSPGGIDGARAMSRFLMEGHFQCILISRPGYLGTPLRATERSIDDEADLHAAVLDAIQVPRAGVVAWSGGGPVAYRLAARHSDRVSAVVAIAAVSYRWDAPQPTLSQRFVFGTSIGQCLVAYLSEHQPEHVIQAALEGEGSLRGDALKSLAEQTAASPEQRRVVLETALTVNTSGRRRDGWQNDVANFAEITSLGLESIKCPVLLIHGDADTDAVLDHSLFAHKTIPSSELIVMEQGTHLAFYAHPEAVEVQQRTKEWLSRHVLPTA